MNTGTSGEVTSDATPQVFNSRKNKAEKLTNADEKEVLDFLSLRPIHTVILAGWIRDHGIVSDEHRGTFYGCRDAKRNISGVAMVGTNLLVEARTEEALEAFAICARDCPDVRMIFAEEEKLLAFWRHFSNGSPMPSVSRHQLIASGSSAAGDIESVDELRVATPHDLDQIVQAHAQMVFVETGIDPLKSDAEGFRMRCSKRVNNGRVWVWVKNGELLFKTDIVSVTPEATYFEGVWVNPKQRSKGVATRCLNTLCNQLLSGSNVITGFLDGVHSLSNSVYRKTGFIDAARYSKIFL